MRSTIERQWRHADLDCAVVRVGSAYMDHRCGYVRVPEDHPWHGLDYTDRVPNPRALPEDAQVDSYGMAGMLALLSGQVADRIDRVEMQVRVHGGVTYAGKSISGLPKGWWFGFDCGHSGDSLARWPEDAVATETERMAEQIAAAREPIPEAS